MHCQSNSRGVVAYRQQSQPLASPGRSLSAVATAVSRTGVLPHPSAPAWPALPLPQELPSMLSQDRQPLPVPGHTGLAGGCSGPGSPELLLQQPHPHRQMWGGGSSAPGARLPYAPCTGGTMASVPTPSLGGLATGMGHQQQQQQNWAPVPLPYSNAPTRVAGGAQPLLASPVTSASRGCSSAGVVGATTAAASTRPAPADRPSRSASPGVYGPTDDLLPSLAWIDIDLALDGNLRSGPGDQASLGYLFGSLEVGEATRSAPDAACTAVKASAAMGLPTAYAIGMQDDGDGVILDYTGDGSQYLRGGENSLALCHVNDDFLDLDIELPTSFSIADSSSLLAATRDPTTVHGGLAVLAAASPPASFAGGVLGQNKSPLATTAAGQCGSAAAGGSLNASGSGRLLGLDASSSSAGPFCLAPPPKFGGSAAPSHLGGGISARQTSHASPAVPHTAGPQLPAASFKHSIGQAGRQSASAAATASSFGFHAAGSSSSVGAPAMSPQRSPVVSLPLGLEVGLDRNHIIAAAPPLPAGMATATSCSERADATPPPANVARLQRMQATEEILRSAGLLDATMLTGRVTARQRVIQFEIQKLKHAMHEFVLSIVCEEPEAKRRRYH